MSLAVAMLEVLQRPIVHLRFMKGNTHGTTDGAKQSKGRPCEPSHRVRQSTLLGLPVQARSKPIFSLGLIRRRFVRRCEQATT
jgi:hypothetical protein